ncbi:hypothetical protein Ferp_1449 [Ferroglobus placidus DSM 10642]|uniref:Roadblock/LAMTOR2 domain-containing protein n=1 Tax=Ferroglobus placidus (strain DSM 10642 / AEDII12DO) TaxID=589924 RepID=D3RYN7_FERPA|nr:hypothetical protein [Ferroglobus placidus]ADC65600.1 hypothetical protein Ferp_1449 [Ferroglobus placidus DSM 10642]
MRSKIAGILEPIAEDEAIAGVVLYRIDGTLIYSKLKRDPKLVLALHNLEEQIKSMLYYIFTRNLKDSVIETADFRFDLRPISKTLVLGIIYYPSHYHKLDVDIKTIINNLRSYLF